MKILYFLREIKITLHNSVEIRSIFYHSIFTWNRFLTQNWAFLKFAQDLSQLILRKILKFPHSCAQCGNFRSFLGSKLRQISFRNSKNSKICNFNIFQKPCLLILMNFLQLLMVEIHKNQNLKHLKFLKNGLVSKADFT